jgi:hypothetical protein
MTGLETAFTMASRSYSAVSLDSMDQSQSDADSDVDAIFTDSGSESDPTSDSELSSEGSGDDESDSDDEYLNDEGQLPPEHYIAEALNLDVSQLRQKRYSECTQGKLDETTMYWNR